jgi:methionyl-tRNA formyltransferase
MDAGAILGQSHVEIGETETAGELHDRLAEDGVKLVLTVLDQLAAGTAVETPQDDAKTTMAPKLRHEDGRIDWTRPAAAIARQIRGMHPWPGCRVAQLDGQQQIARLTLVRARAVPGDQPDGEPGRLLATGHVAAGEGALDIVELQPEGKRPMLLGAYRNGHPWQAGMRLESIT